MFRTLYGKLGTLLLGLFLVVAGVLALTAERMPADHFARFVLEILAAGAVFALVSTLVLFHTLTRRLSRLACAMERFKESDFTGKTRLDADLGGDDEIGRLGDTFRQMAERLCEQVRAIRESDKLQRELLANVSHDLRTPLAALRGYLETLLLKQASLTPEERRTYLEIATKQSERLSRLVDELFDLAKLDAGKVSLERESFPVDELIQDIVQKYRPAAEDKGIRLEANCPETAPPILADIGLVERVLENLIENALHHTPAGGKVSVHMAPHATGTTIEVSDTGQGIKPQDLPHVFERFYRGDGAASGHPGGAGLGLAIARRIVELHDGTMEVHSEPGHGARFVFHLPAPSVISRHTLAHGQSSDAVPPSIAGLAPYSSKLSPMHNRRGA